MRGRRVKGFMNAASPGLITAFQPNSYYRNPEDYLADLVEALNAATADIAPQQMRMHVCWGNYEGPHDHDIPLERVIGIILKARPATILFEAANSRHEHAWKVWAAAKIPEDKVLAPGLIDTCSNYVEHPELIAQRIERFTNIVGAERVMASTDCGFGTFAGYGKIDPAVTWKKLRSLCAGADIAAARLRQRTLHSVILRVLAEVSQAEGMSAAIS